MYFKSKKIDDPIYGHFDSEAEFKYFINVLLPLQEKGVIKDLDRQVKYLLIPSFKDSLGNTVLKMEYKSDFTYFDIVNNKIIIVDVKGSAFNIDEKFKVKWKLLKYLQRDEKNIEYQIVIEYSPNKKIPEKWYNIEDKNEKKEYKSLYAEANKNKKSKKKK